MSQTINIIGGGLAGSEAAWRAAANGLSVTLWEMKPEKFSPAHKLESLAELVCSNSFRADTPDSAIGLLKEELRLLGSLIMLAADKCAVKAGRALAVDRLLFSQMVTDYLSSNPKINIKRAEFLSWPEAQNPIVIAGGPLASEGLVNLIQSATGQGHLYFYDALAPIVTRESLDMSKIFLADRYGTEEGDYLNCPMTENEFLVFLTALTEADQTSPRPFEEAKFFEGCLPIEVMAARGPRTLTFGPMKPVGLIDPRTGKRPAAVVQLRRENQSGTIWNMVGFQTRLTKGAQNRVFRLIPGLEQAEFSRYGAIHRNTYLEAPKILDEYQRLKTAPHIFIAGQMSGVEGYVESTAQGLWAGENASRAILGHPLVRPPRATAMGSLLSHLEDYGGRKNFAPSNINFGLFPAPPQTIHRRDHLNWRLTRARESWEPFLKETGYVYP